MRWMRQLLIMVLVGLVGGSMLAGCSAAEPPPAVATATPTPGSPGHRVVKSVQVQDHLVDLTVDSAAVGREVKVRLLLPADFAEQPTRHWPVLYLLHGCCDNYDAWTRSTDVERLSRRSPMIVAMPEGGDVGFYSDWVSGPKWETFHTLELPGLLAREYRASDRQAIAGLSMGGLGALAYAARHPDQYAAVASFSGITHTLYAEHARNYLRLVESEGEDPLALWGDPDRDVVVWGQHNPYHLVEQLKGRPVFLSCGNGSPGPLDPTRTGPDDIEESLYAENEAFAERLKEVGVDAQIRLYGDGTHNWPYWQRELGMAWPMLTKALGLTG
jgi:S-formylglutathione hydrolase FrmB